MTPYLAGVVFCGLLGLLNLVLTYGVIRRLRQHDTALAERPGGGPDADVMAPAGSPLGTFTATTVDGSVVSAGELAGPTAVGFFSTGCAPCVERLPEFLRYAATFPGGRDNVLVVVVTERADEARDTFVAQATAVANVVVEPHDGPVGTALRVRGYPALAVVDDGSVVSSGSELDALPALSQA
ncbi:TlpA family protein disulfide reductase [Virgisporangium aurantiacum]|uniref:Thioredoxin domain-containing protein n=1 Tax=Virgisporangium aurantiacum TaxID=175570 RepID=A0A8J4E9Q2_9ACTN|nr:TlpA disulfide reductase family protein [Virgisporangium aurantiacum]GIJ63972.1 hypothetical protein Vau01_114880 [Virgisporangium aurantiacum]